MKSLNIADQEYLIRSVRDTDSIEELTELLHRAYAGLAAMGLRYYATHQPPSVTAERLNGDFSYLIVTKGIDSSIVGTITLYDQPADCESPWYGTAGVWRFGQFGIEPTLQGQGIGLQAMQFIETIARNHGARELACDTAEPAEHLVRWYHSMGYRFIEHVRWPEVNYQSVILSKSLE